MCVPSPRHQVEVTVGGRLFYLPLFILGLSPYLNRMYQQRVANMPWSLSEVNADVFALVLDALVRGALSGTERGLNLPLLLEAIRLAYDLDLSPATNTLALAIPRYIVERCFFFNPHGPHRGMLNNAYFRYRSEDIYRAWQVLQRFPRLHQIIEDEDLYLLYAYVIPQGFWMDFTLGYDGRFTDALERLDPQPDGGFLEVWARFQRVTLRTNNAWFPGTGLFVDDVFRREQDSAVEPVAAVAAAAVAVPDPAPTPAPTVIEAPVIGTVHGSVGNVNVTFYVTGNNIPVRYGDDESDYDSDDE